MKVSMNELKSSLKNCFEANGYYVGNFEDAAEMVVWLETHGLNGLEAFQKALAHLSLDHEKPLATISKQQADELSIDCFVRSGLNCISSIIDMAHAKALEDGHSKITVKQCRDRQFIIKAITDCGRRGMSVKAQWVTADEDKLIQHDVVISRNDLYPTYRESFIPLDEVTIGPEDLLIECYRDKELDISETLQSVEHYLEMTPKEMISHYENCLYLGVDIDKSLWTEMTRVGLGILVENSEQSQRGAGA